MAGVAASFSTSELVRLDETLWEIPAATRADMRVPARVFADEELLGAIVGDRSLEQLQNVATLPGIVEAALAMPDIHQGYGFPVGGVAAMELPDGVVSPGGVGYDINCGVRLLALPLSEVELGRRREALVHELSRAIPSGAGKQGPLALSSAELDGVLRDGPRALIARGIGREDDLERTESHGCLPGADAGARLRPRARAWGRTARDGRLGQPLHRAPASRARLRPRRGRGLRAARGTGDGADPLGLARPRPSGVHRPRAADGRGRRSLRHRASRPAARLRAGLLA